jgi:hypothetical protein
MAANSREAASGVCWDSCRHSEEDGFQLAGSPSSSRERERERERERKRGLHGRDYGDGLAGKGDDTGNMDPAISCQECPYATTETWPTPTAHA